ncbi:MAG: hypothetical protein WCC64_03565 [Aliidongia sp.]
MLPPDQRLFEEDVQTAPYRIGVAKGLWAQAESHTLPDGAAWPKAYFGPGEEGAARYREMAEGQAGKPVRDGVPGDRI